MKKTGIISQARMTSTRLPGKILKPIKGRTILDFHVERLALSDLPFYIATTTNATDEPVIDFCRQKNIGYYRGDEQHVLSRYYECARENKLEVIVRVTSDCPLIDGEIIKAALEIYLAQNNPKLYLSNALVRTFARGFDFEIFSFELLERAYKHATLPGDLEHVTPYIHQNRTGDVDFYHFTNPEDKSAYRITLDTPEDFELIKALIEDYSAENLNAQQIIEILDQHPELAAMNAHIEQKKV